MKQKTPNYRITSMILILSLLCTACGRSATASVMKLLKTEGSVEVSDGEGREISPAENLMLYSGYQMDTRKESYAWINLDSVKLTKMDENSEIEIQKDGNKLEIFVNSGKLFFHITEPLKEEETLNIRTSNMAVGIRGTCGWVEVTDPSLMRVYILEGTVECGVMDPESMEIITADVSGGEMAELVWKSEDDESNCEIRTSAFTEYSLPDFVRVEILQDEALREKIQDNSGLNITADLTSPQAYPRKKVILNGYDVLLQMGYQIIEVKKGVYW